MWGIVVARERLTGETASDWGLMANGSLISAAQIVWQSRGERDDIRALFHKVSGFNVNQSEWDTRLTWAGAQLLALSIEQSFKAMSIAGVADASCFKTHDLVALWNDLECSCRSAVRSELETIRHRAQGTRLEQATLQTADEIVDVHSHTFVHARYYNGRGNPYPAALSTIRSLGSSRSPHFERQRKDSSGTPNDRLRISAEAALDGLYMVRTSLAETQVVHQHVGERRQVKPHLVGAQHRRAHRLF